MKVEDLSINEIIRMFYDWQYEPDRCDIFYFHIISAVKTADKRNRKRLDIIYPNFVYIYNLWCAAGDYGNDLFREHRVGRFADERVIDLDYSG